MFCCHEKIAIVERLYSAYWYFVLAWVFEPSSRLTRKLHSLFYEVPGLSSQRAKKSRHSPFQGLWSPFLLEAATRTAKKKTMLKPVEKRNNRFQAKSASLVRLTE